MSSKNTPVIVGGAVVVVLALALAYLLFSSITAFSEASSQLDDSNGKLKRLHRRAVFPSKDNAANMEQQAEDFSQYLAELSGALRQGQPATNSFTRDRFLSEFGATMHAFLSGRAKGVQIAAPQNATYFDLFGFGLYKTGTPPNEKDLPRVMAQMQDVKAVCESLYDAGIAEILGVKRTEFEIAAAEAAAIDEEEEGARSRRNRNRGQDAQPAALPGALYKDPDGLFTRESYTFSFKASDAALQRVLDSLAKGQPFVVVTSLVINNTARPTVQAPPPPPGGATAAPGIAVGIAAQQPPASAISGFRALGAAAPQPAQKEAPTILPRELRVSAGQELPVIEMKVDVYRFLDLSSPVSEEEAE